jgi:DNA-binding CsgD family transcriptional regulator
VVSADPESRQHLAYAHAYRAFGLWLLGRSRLAQRALGRTPHDLDERDYVFLSVIRSICFSPRATMTHQKLELLTNAFTALDLQGHARFLRRLFSPVIAESNLSRLELDVLREFERGGTYAEVADRLHVPRRTVEKRLQVACRKLGCSGRTEAVEFAAGRGWLD